MTVDTEQEAIALANDSQFGLGASVWTLDRAKGERIADRIQSGMVWINDHSYTHGACQCSWGGVKDSGLGRSHSKFGFYECVNIKLVSWEPSRIATSGGTPTTRCSARRSAPRPPPLRRGDERAERCRGPIFVVGDGCSVRAHESRPRARGW